MSHTTRRPARPVRERKLPTVHTTAPVDADQKRHDDARRYADPLYASLMLDRECVAFRELPDDVQREALRLLRLDATSRIETEQDDSTPRFDGDESPCLDAVLYLDGLGRGAAARAIEHAALVDYETHTAEERAHARAEARRAQAQTIGSGGGGDP